MKIDLIQTDTQFSLKIVRLTILFFFLLCIVWIGAWLLEQVLEEYTDWLNTSQGRFFYWFFMKLMIWIMPSCLLIRYSGKKFMEIMSVKRIQSIIIWGGGIGLLLGVLTLSVKMFFHQPIFSFEILWSFIGGVIVSPIAEEITFRGAIFSALTQRYHFGLTNSITALFFLGIHLPGWYFQGILLNNLASPVGGALSIFVLGIIFGYVAYKSKSVSASIISHALNNLFNV